MPVDSIPGTAPQQQHPGQYHGQGQYQPLDQAAVKLTRGTSCVLCQQRKVRCDKNKPCANCVKAKVECRKRLQEKDLIDRLKKYESLLAEHGVKVDAIGHELRPDGPPADDVEDLQDDFEGLKTSPEASASPSASQSLNEDMLHDSSEDEENAGMSTIHRAFDRMFATDGFPFMIGAQPNAIYTYHPPTIQIFQLWQIYIDNINPLLKITHVPSVQAQVIAASTNIEKAPKNIEALMFSIYLLAITSLEEVDVQKMFNESRQELLGRYHSAAQQALCNAGFMRVNDPILLQAYLLYCMAVRWFVDPRQVFCLVGIGVRIAHRMGLHTDPAQFGLPPFEVEQRRRLWWALVAYDRRMGEMTGSTVTALSSGGDCKIPLNVNDSDLHVDGKELPTPHSGPTEMLFALTRIELAMAVASDSNRDSAKNNPEKSPQPSPNARPTTTIRLAGQNVPAYTLDGFCAHIEGTYLSQCDPKIPLHFFTLTMTRQALCKMRIINFLVRMHDSDPLPLMDIERDNLFLQATQMIEYDNIVQSSESLRPFKWYSMHHFPFPAYMFLVQELRHRVVGPMVERAWDAISKNHTLRGLLNNYHSPMHIAFGGHFIKAWEAHEAALVSAGKPVERPSFLELLKHRAEARRKARAENRPDPASLMGPDVNIPRSSTTPSESGAMMTPPTDSSTATSNAPPVGSGSITSGEDPGEMDWSYLISGYGGNSSNNFPPMGGFGSFGTFSGGGGPMHHPMPPMGGGMGRMGGMGSPPGGGNMFGN
ncbi:fungal-specific transcription factor domain-containing protein [Thelonectria olida]|uniref:Fungal-specific transcription factor domain-containing protein n=1 Tax=Thelonectria olida TaxID=1576542 RepID=A0A9P8WC18_9HYPO|nr:fungal-specific transcription factor domain-containing protein [Thelonectria olida]